MRIRSTAHATASTLITLGVVVGLVLPAGPALASEPDEPTETASELTSGSGGTSIAAGSAPDAEPAPEPSRAAVTAGRPTPPPSPAPPPRTDTAATSSTIGLHVEVAEDGNGPFTPTDDAGGDTSAENGVVRTMDAITYRVSLNSNDATSTNERFTATAPEGTTWAGVPGVCTGAGSAISGADLTCTIGTLDEGTTVFVPIVLDVSGDLRNGDSLAVHVTATADNAGNGPVEGTSPATTVSAASRYNLSNALHVSTLRTGVTGPDGTSDGLQLVYPIAVDWQPVVAGQGLLGFERSVGPMTFTDDLSQILGATPSNAVLWNGGDPVCGPNLLDGGQMGGLPGGVGGGEQAVTDSGRFTCDQSAPGQDVDVTIDRTVTDPTHIPSKSITNGPIAGGTRFTFVSGFISLWMPNPSAGTSARSINTYTALQTTSASGATNFPGGTEPLADNVTTRTIVGAAAGSAQKNLYRVVDDGRTTEPGSARGGDPWTTPGSVLRSDVGAENPGLARFDDVIICDTFDRDTQRLTRAGDGEVAAITSNLSAARVQYAAYDMPSPAAGQRATCDDHDGPWYDQPEDVPGGIAAVGAVRATGDIAGGDTAALYSYVTVQDAADGTRAYDFGHAWFGDRAERWVHDIWSDPDLGAGPLSDSVLITENLARIQKKIVDPGHDAGDTPDDTSFAVAGNTVDYALYPSLTNGHTTGIETTVTVRDVLPRHMTYAAGSASLPPHIDTTKDADGNGLQRLTWTLVVRPNEAIDPITYTTAISNLAPAGPITNVTEIASPTDRSAAEFRDAARALQIVTTGGVGVQKAAVDPVVVTGDVLEWTLGYTNTDASTIDGLDVIDVLPHRGDGRNSAFHGSTGLARPVAVDADSGERVRYTGRRASDVVLDPADHSNTPGGATRWCTEAEFGAAGCPTELADVTAFRILRTASVGVGESVEHEVAVVTSGQQDGDRYTNRFGLRASNLALPVQSNPATVTVVAGAVGDRVWSDEDGDGIQDRGESGIDMVPVRLTGADDRGDEVVAETTTDDDGEYHFDGLRPGTYRVHWTAPEGREFAEGLVGGDRGNDSDADDDGSTGIITIAALRSDEGRLAGVERNDTVDAGIMPAAVTPVTPPVDPVEPGDPEEQGQSIDPTKPGTSGSRPAADGTEATERTSADSLASTGAEGVGVLVAAAALLIVSGGFLLVRRRVQTTDRR